MKLAKIGYIVSLATVIGMSGCSSKGGTKPEDAAGANASGAQVGKYGTGSDYGANQGGMPNVYAGGQNGNLTGDPELDNPASPLSKRVIYFQYDSNDVLPEYVSIISAHAQYLTSHPQRSITLEGNTDERGTREYNIALGERRAQAVAKLLKVQGVSDSQVQTVSYGEEKPASPGHDEQAYQLNRRAEIVYAGSSGR